MRIRFAVPDTPEATAARELCERADEFFALAAERTKGASLPGDTARLEHDLAGALVKVWPGLMVEVDHAGGQARRVVLSPADDAGLEPLIALVLRRAPTGSGVGAALSNRICRDSRRVP